MIGTLTYVTCTRGGCLSPAESGAAINEESKADAIRRVFETKGRRTRGKNVQAILLEQGIKVTSSQVSWVRKQLRRKKLAAKAQARMVKAGYKMSTGYEMPKKARPSRNGGLTLKDLMAAKDLVNQVGSVAVLRQVLDVLEKIG
jgi:hypothetical protein